MLKAYVEIQLINANNSILYYYYTLFFCTLFLCTLAPQSCTKTYIFSWWLSLKALYCSNLNVFHRFEFSEGKTVLVKLHLALWRQNNILEEILWRVVCWSEKKWCFYCLYTGLHMVLNASKEESLIDIQTFIFWRLVKKEMVMVGNIIVLHWYEFAALFSTKLFPHFILFILYAALIKIKIKSFSHVVWKKNEKEVSSATSSETI